MQKDENLTDNQVTCECGRIYNKSNRSKHMNRWHEGIKERNITCNLCNKSYSESHKSRHFKR
jgi:hypothetical protein